MARGAFSLPNAPAALFSSRPAHSPLLLPAAAPALGSGSGTAGPGRRHGMKMSDCSRGRTRLLRHRLFSRSLQPELSPRHGAAAPTPSPFGTGKLRFPRARPSPGERLGGDRRRDGTGRDGAAPGASLPPPSSGLGAVPPAAAQGRARAGPRRGRAFAPRGLRRRVPSADGAGTPARPRGAPPGQAPPLLTFACSFRTSTACRCRASCELCSRRCREAGPGAAMPPLAGRAPPPDGRRREPRGGRDGLARGRSAAALSCGLRGCRGGRGRSGRGSLRPAPLGDRYRPRPTLGAGAGGNGPREPRVGGGPRRRARAGAAGTGRRPGKAAAAPEPLPEAAASARAAAGAGGPARGETPTCPGGAPGPCPPRRAARRARAASRERGSRGGRESFRVPGQRAPGIQRYFMG